MIYKIKQKHTKHTTINTVIEKRTRRMWNKCDKRSSHISSKLHLICISSNNDRHPVTKTFTPLQYFSKLHFFPFKTSRNCTSLQYSFRHFTSSHLKLHPTTLHTTSLHFSTLHFFPFKTSPNYTSLHFTTLVDTSLFPISTSPNYTSLHFTTLSLLHHILAGQVTVVLEPN